MESTNFEPGADEVTIIAGDGDSPASAIQFSPCNLEARMAAERRYITERFGTEGTDWERGMHFSRFGSISEWNLDLCDGTSAKIFFSTANTIYSDEYR